LDINKDKCECGGRLRVSITPPIGDAHMIRKNEFIYSPFDPHGSVEYKTIAYYQCVDCDKYYKYNRVEVTREMFEIRKELFPELYDS